MSYSVPKELIKAEKLIEEGNIEKALQIVNDFGKKKNISSHERIAYYIFKSRLAGYCIDRNERTKYAEKAYQESQNLENSLLLLDVYLQMVDSLMWNLKTIEASEFIKKCEDLLNILPQELSTELAKRKGYLLWLKGYYYLQKEKLEKAKDCAERALVLQQKLDLKADIARSLIQLGEFSWRSGDFNNALKYAKSCKTLAKKFNWVEIINYTCYNLLGIIYLMKGELDFALSYFEQVLKYAKKENNLFFISGMYNHKGMIYQEKGDFSRALENLEKSVSIMENHGSNLEIFVVVDSLFHLALDMNDLEKAQRYLNRMKKIADQEESILIHQGYYLDRAIYLKNSPRAFNRGKAEEMLKQLIGEGIPEFEFLKMALLNLCDLLLSELLTTNEPEILDELQTFISQLFDVVKNSRSYSLLAETYLLQARLALITLDMKKARQLLIKAQEIAEKYGLNRLTIKISNEHDELLKQLDVWDNLKELKTPLSERLKLARLNDQMERMIYKREIVVPELTDEDPIVLLIISEGGRPLFSESFAEEWAFEDHLFGGFLTAINSFSDEMFSEGLNRANFGEYTIIMNSLDPFLVCYLFKGQSYLAQQRVAKFIDHVKEDEEIWDKFNKFNQACQLVQLKDVPSLEPLITKIFVDKNVPLIA